MATKFFHSVWCETTLPDDAPDVIDETIEECIGGEGAAAIVSGWLKQEGVTVRPPELHEGHCWEIGARFRDRTFLVATVQLRDHVHIAVWDHSFFLRKILFGDTAHRTLVLAVHKHLSSDKRFHSLRWYDPYYPKKDAPSPVPEQEFIK